MATCNATYHRGNREVTRIKGFYRDGWYYEGCLQCIEPMLTNLYPAQKRLVISKGTGKHFWISPAHVRDIKRRRVAPDMSHTWTDRKGIGGDMRY